MKNILEGVRVIDFSRVLAGPFCTMNLADFGAEVIKIERPGLGDDSRIFGPFINDESSYFIFVNRGKKSMTLDLKNPQSIEILKDLIRMSDVVVENFKPGVMKKLGLDYETLKTVNPEIIYCSISGFGQHSPYSGRPAYDIVAQAMGGIMSITGYPDNPPARVGCSLGDISAGLYAAFGIVSALFHRQSTGQGQHIDIAMLDSVFSFLESNIMRYTVGGEVPGRIGSRHPISAPFDSFSAKDGMVIIAIASDGHFKLLCDLMEMPDLMKDPLFHSDPRRVENQEGLKEIIETWLSAFTVEEATEKLQRGGIPCSEILDIGQVCQSEHIRMREMVVEIDHAIAGRVKIPGNPVKMSETPPQVVGSAPLLGEHTDDILKRYLHYDEGAIARLKSEAI